MSQKRANRYTPPHLRNGYTPPHLRNDYKYGQVTIKPKPQKVTWKHEPCGECAISIREANKANLGYIREANVNVRTSLEKSVSKNTFETETFSCNWKVSKNSNEMLWDNDLLDHFNPAHCPTIYHNIKGVMDVLCECVRECKCNYDYLPYSRESIKFRELKYINQKTYAEIACQTTVKTRNMYVQTEKTVVMTQEEYQRMIHRLSPSPNWYPQTPFIPMFRPISPYM